MARVHALDFDEYFRGQYPQLVRELDLILGDTDLAHDVAQERAFIRQYTSWTRLSHFDKPGAWVRKVALRMAFRKRRNYFRETPLDEHLELAAPTAESERVLDVRRAIQQLTEAQRVAVVLFYYRDLPITEVAAAMGCKDATAKVHLHNARKRLAELLVHYS